MNGAHSSRRWAPATTCCRNLYEHHPHGSWFNDSPSSAMLMPGYLSNQSNVWDWKQLVRRGRLTDSSWRAVLAIPVQDDCRHRRRFARQNVDEKPLAITSRRVIIPARKPLLNTRAEEFQRGPGLEGGVGLHANGHDRAGVGSIEQLFARSAEHTS